MNSYAWIGKSLKTIHRAHWHRSPHPIDGKPGPVITIAGQPVVNFASNDYLGLAGDARLAAAAIAAIHVYGTGSTGSRLLSGHRPIHRELEQAIAALKHTEDTLVFSSGYLANLGAIAALVGPKDLILADQYNHSSLINGARLSGATTLTYAHCDIADLERQLEHRTRYRRCLIVTDTVFSMDGDLCPLPEILGLAEKFEAMVLVDEAHGTGVLGQTGAGVVEHLGCIGQPLVQIGTLSKAIGSLGGYVTGSAQLIDYLRNRAPSWIYTTGLSPADAAAALQAIEIIRSEPERRDRLWRNLAYLSEGLRQFEGVKLIPSESPIVCIEGDRPAEVVHMGQQLMERGLFVSAVRPPTTPTSRLRITLMATHSLEHIDHLLGGLAAVLNGDRIARNL